MNPKPIHTGNLETFLEVYAEKLKANVAANPSNYSWGLDESRTWKCSGCGDSHPWRLKSCPESSYDEDYSDLGSPYSM